MRTLTADLAIIGSGSGNSLITPYWDDKRVVLAESGVFGGTCLNVGCIPTKMFVRPAALARGPEEAARLGVSQVTTAVDWPGIRDRVFSRIDAISEAGERYREELGHVELVSQRVRFDAPGSLIAEDGTRIEADRIVIAAGSRAVLPDVPGIDLPGVHTSDTVMRIPEPPERVLVIGGGYIACEFAGVFSGLGSEVLQAVRTDRLLRSADDDIAERFTVEAARQWELLRGRRLQRISAGEGVRGLVAEFATGEGSEERTERVAADVVLVATGRRPNSDLVGAAEAGLDLHDDGRIAVDEYQRVLSAGAPVPGVYALGDVCSPWQLKHVANHEARIVAHNLEHPDEPRSSRLLPVPSAVFTSPEIAQAGLTESQAAERVGAEHLSVKLQDYGDTAYGWAMEDTTGVFKVIADRRDGTILGVHAMGYQASNLIQPAIMAMSFGLDAHTAARGQYWIHPALMEVTENAMLGVEIDGR
ncbi:mycothione reductase [Leucobacter ruminantium]|uniref:Mycothione reductase n=1 Tax=Leucobacter ruminantium TaxID=1289170 RepID=A0A939RY46_9MICO|nr:mycothione reductase [Leucobacter ruminantium]MBO1804084.1 mycothione reductase [Leucobacter ruminantium]